MPLCIWMGLKPYSADIFVLKILSALSLYICCFITIISFWTTFSMEANNMKSDQTIWAHIIGLTPITQLHTCIIKIVTFKGGHSCGKSDLSYHKELLLKERIHSLWEQILSFKRSSHFEKDRN